ncbi:Thymidylate synthase [Invertebrate iridovirus 25]|uniref:thymidylate synthase n=1 Tax=Invertebrate iridovirus 25 TaxID=1301280 RepID=W8W2G7_9VIRU|nr:Thymidylate synthase [Invertebrate iridovirus 25]CCV02175.1 Thymidylate synthase [Invertebrate iridovirus 25]
MEQDYLNLVDQVISCGDYHIDRTKVGTYSLFGKHLEFDLSEGIVPLLTTKKIVYKNILKELLWIMKGLTNSNLLNDIGVKVWNDNGSRKFLDSCGFHFRKEGDLGPIYGFQWRHAGAQYIDCDTNYIGQGIDQLSQVIETIKNNPECRRIIIDSWNVSQLPDMALPPCHCLVQFYVRNKIYLDCQLYQRSADLGLGVPYNIAFYSFLVCVLSKWCNLTPGKFIHTFGDVHVYSNHIDQLKIQLSRNPYKFPKVKFTGNFTLKDLDNLNLQECCDMWCNSFEVTDYTCHPFIKMPMAI